MKKKQKKLMPVYPGMGGILSLSLESSFFSRQLRPRLGTALGQHAKNSDEKTRLPNLDIIYTARKVKKYTMFSLTGIITRLYETVGIELESTVASITTQS